MNSPNVPQPHPSRITPFHDHPLVVGVQPGQPDVVALTAAGLACALGGTIYFAYADPARTVEREFADGTVQHRDANPDLYDDDTWRIRQSELTAAIRLALADSRVAWEFRYLAGRPDRALTHLARAVDASLIVVGSGRHGGGARLHDLLQRPVGVHLANHQHRPVLVVPVSVVDWKTRLG